MARQPTTWLRSIRRRPAQERRILAVTTYISAAAIVGALGITSLRNTIADLAAPPSGAAEASGRSSSESLRDLATPFQTLQDGLRGALSELNQFFQDANSPLETGDGDESGGDALEDVTSPDLRPAPPGTTGATSTAQTGDGPGELGDYLSRKLQPRRDSPPPSE